MCDACACDSHPHRYKIIYGPGDLSYNREIGTITMGYFIVDWTSMLGVMASFCGFALTWCAMLSPASVSMKEYISHKDEVHCRHLGVCV